MGVPTPEPLVMRHGGVQPLPEAGPISSIQQDLGIAAQGEDWERPLLSTGNLSPVPQFPHSPLRLEVKQKAS